MGYFESGVIPTFGLDISTPLICIMNHHPWGYGEQKPKAPHLALNCFLEVEEALAHGATESITFWLISRGGGSPH